MLTASPRNGSNGSRPGRERVMPPVSRRGAKPVDRARFPILTAKDLAQPVPRMEWLVRGFWPLGSHGPIGGPKKTLKSYLADAEAIAVASGLPVLGNDEWKIPEPTQVIIFAGEGGVNPLRRRLHRIARDLYGINRRNFANLPLIVLPGIAHFDSPEFRRYLADAIETADAVTDTPLIIVDSVYNYHPPESGVSVANLYARGQMFGRLSHLVYQVAGEYASLQLVDHFRKTGNGALDLDSISQSGMAEFADTWLLVNNRLDPDPDNGKFWTRAEFGSRQDWPGAGWEIDWNIGRYDVDTGEWSDPITVDFRSCGRARSGQAAETVSDGEIAGAIREYVRAHPDGCSKTQARTAIKGELAIGQTRFDQVWLGLEDSGLVVTNGKGKWVIKVKRRITGPRSDSGRTRVQADSRPRTGPRTRPGGS